MNKLVYLFETMRLSHTPMVLSNVLLGVAMAGLLEPTVHIFYLIIAMVLLYCSGTLLNDFVDYKKDREEGNDTPVSKKLLSRWLVLFIAALCIFISLLILSIFDMSAFYWGLVLVGCILLYNLLLRKTFLIALCWMIIYLACAVAIGSFQWSFMLPCIGLILYILTVEYFAKRTTDAGKVAYMIAGIALFDAFFLLLVKAWLFAGISVVAFLYAVILLEYMKGEENKKFVEAK